jgi:hypothetical protein
LVFVSFALQVRAVPIDVLEKEYDAGDASYVPRPAHYRKVLFDKLRRQLK